MIFCMAAVDLKLANRLIKEQIVCVKKIFLNLLFYVL